MISAAPTERTFEELVALVQEHQPTPVERYTFFTRVERRLMTMWPSSARLLNTASLAKPSTTCALFVDVETKSSSTSFWLTLRSPLTKLCMAIAKASELADRGTRNLSGQNASVSRLLDTRRHKPPTVFSLWCSSSGNYVQVSTARSMQGHISKVCRKRTRYPKAASRSTTS